MDVVGVNTQNNVEPSCVVLSNNRMQQDDEVPVSEASLYFTILLTIISMTTNESIQLPPHLSVDNQSYLAPNTSKSGR